MSSYVGRHAALYDTFYSDKPYDNEAAFVHHCLTRFGLKDTKRLLEVACGTGSHAFALERYGYQITATDYSEDMIEVARSKAVEKKSTVTFSQADMTNLDNVEGTFDAAISLFDSIGYVQTNERLTQTFNQVRQRLNPGGVFVFEFWHAAAMIPHHDALRIRRWTTEEGTLLRVSKTSLNVARQISEVHYTIYELSKDGTYKCFEETQSNRYFLLQEMSYIITSCGFEPVTWFAGFTESELINEETWHIVAVARTSSTQKRI
ncbi:MAG: hypothetical protein C5B55_04920 [Blastocatellia bacterium]|nr:MAG: hypothetical protein C5B55_04920 [Blastocatellia bacterium]